MDDMTRQDEGPDAPRAANRTEASATPRREVRDPRELRALAHPLRLRLLEELATLGEATATELAERVEASAANCSWHLRQLARYGYIEEAGGGTGRARPWRWVPRATQLAADEDREPEARVARDAVLEVLLDREHESWRAWHAHRDEAPRAWRDASFETLTLSWLTVEELSALKQDLAAVMERHLVFSAERADPQRRPTGARLIRVFARSFPAEPAAELPEAAAEIPDAGRTQPEPRDPPVGT